MLGLWTRKLCITLQELQIWSSASVCTPVRAAIGKGMRPCRRLWGILPQAIGRAQAGLAHSAPAGQPRIIHMLLTWGL